MKYYEVLPLKKTGAENQTFTYQSEEDLELGVMVSVPLKNRLVRGIITEEVNKPKYVTRPVKKALTTEPVILEDQLELAQKISDYYYSSLGETINAFLPFDLGKKRRTKNDQKSETNDREKPHTLNENQKNIYESIESAKPKTTHLIHGVTGSGKTEIYLQLAEKALKNGEGVIFLVPEISLTPQTLSRFEKRFGNQVATWHSQLKETEKFKNWNDLKNGNKLIALGARSAIFLPVRNLKYIIIDEEHESTYKQDKNPKYDAIKVARWRCESLKSKLILGSATPKIDSYFKAKNNEYFYYSLNTRIIQKSMPPVSIVDMRKEYQKGNKAIFSDHLNDSIQKTLKEHKQIILFVNRRGASTFVVCRDCGHVEKCQRCEIPLVYHPNEGNKLACHHCEYKKELPTVCPNCNSHAIKYFGLGTQRVEIEVKKKYPNAKVARMDRDTTKQRGSHQELYESFSNKKFDILIGTQIIAKGWDLPDVNLVGVIAADTTLNIPDYQSAEKTFSLLTQVAGRTGRSYHPGEVIIQTYNPKSYPVRYAKEHDYIGFYEEEIISREKYKYPPFSVFIKLIYRSKNELRAKEKCQQLYDLLEENIVADKVKLLGPTTSFIYKKNNYYHWQIIIKIEIIDIDETKKEKIVIDLNKKVKKIIPTDWSIDVEPSNLL